MAREKRRRGTSRRGASARTPVESLASSAGEPLYQSLLSILARHDPLGLARRSLPVESAQMLPSAFGTGMEPADGAVRPPRRARQRLKPAQGSDLAAAAADSKVGLRAMERLEPEPDLAAERLHLQLRRDYGRVYNDAISILSRHDPSLARFGEATAREYEAEARAILPRLRHAASEVDVRRVLEEEFSRLFGRSALEERDAPASARWEEIGVELWEAVRRERGLGPR
jgi:hypothetical protein